MVAQLLATLGITKTHSRPRQSNDNAYSEAQFKTLKYRPDCPARFGSLKDAQAFCRRFFAWYNNEHYHTGLGLLTPHQVHYGLAKEGDRTAHQGARSGVRSPSGTFRPEAADDGPRPAAEVWINQPTAETIEFQPLTTTSALKGVDTSDQVRYRPLLNHLGANRLQSLVMDPVIHPNELSTSLQIASASATAEVTGRPKSLPVRILIYKFQDCIPNRSSARICS